MNLVRFLTIGIIVAILLGEFGKYPFGAVGNSVNVLDILAGFTGLTFLTWKIGIKKQIDFPKLFWLLVGFSGIGLISLLINYNFSGFFYLARFCLYSLLFWISYSLTKNHREHFEYLQKIMLCLGAGLSLLGFLQLIFFSNLTFLTDFGYDPHILRLTSTFLDPNFLGALVSILYAVAFIHYQQTKQLRYLLILALFGLAIVLTFSRSAWLMWGVLQLFILRYLPKKIIICLVILGLLSILLIPKIQQRLIGGLQMDVSASERIYSWQKGISLFQINPLVGVGFNNVRTVSVENDLVKPFTTDGGNSGAGIDSSWILVAATTGIIGFITLMSFYMSLVVVFLRNHRLMTQFVMGGVLISLFINSQFINSFFYPPIMILFFLLTGGFYATAARKD